MGQRSFETSIFTKIQNDIQYKLGSLEGAVTVLPSKKIFCLNWLFCFPRKAKEKYSLYFLTFLSSLGPIELLDSEHVTQNSLKI